MTGDPRWRDVDAYLDERLLRPDPDLEAVHRENTAAGLPAIDLSSMLGKFLHLLARIAGARRILEIGTLGGYSAIWLARALPPGGRLITLEIDARYAEVAGRNIDRAGLASVVEIRVGPALETLEELIAHGEPFDLIFIDADKPNNAAYVEAVLRVSRPGTVIVVDNVVRGGALLDGSAAEPSTAGSRRLMDLAHDRPELDATVVQTVGVKGYDGMFVAVVEDAEKRRTAR